MPNISMMQPSLIRSLSAFAPFIAEAREENVPSQDTAALPFPAYFVCSSKVS